MRDVAIRSLAAIAGVVVIGLLLDLSAVAMVLISVTAVVGVGIGVNQQRRAEADDSSSTRGVSPERPRDDPWDDDADSPW